MKEATIETTRGGKMFAVENDTFIEDKLRILLSGKKLNFVFRNQSLKFQKINRENGRNM